MAPPRDTRRYRRAYAALLRLYPKRHRERFAEGMAQTFNDVLRERARSGRSLLPAALALGAETAGWIVKDNLVAAMQHKHFVRPAVGTGLILSIPLVMTILDRHKPVGEGWHWGPASFVVMGALLFGAGLMYELLAARSPSVLRRAAIGAAIAFGVFAIWAELAVDAVSQLLRFVFG